jgi:glyoxylase-like metal-dependent hydrolase (beta-lactamase superfamily II)
MHPLINEHLAQLRWRQLLADSERARLAARGERRMRKRSPVSPHRKEGTAMDSRVQRIAGQVMTVNSFLVYGSEGVVVVDGMLTVSDAALVRAAVDLSGAPLAGVVITHPHPDHYAGLAHLVGRDDVPIVATRAVDAVIRRDDALKGSVVGPMMGAEWPVERLFPNHLVGSGETGRMGGLTLTVEELGPGESDMDTVWWLDRTTVFAGDLAYNGTHAYLADGRWRDWLATLASFEARLDDDVTLHVGHGPSGTKALLAAQRRYIEAFIAALDANSDTLAAGDHGPVLAAMRDVVPGDDLLFLLDLSIEPVHAERTSGAIAARR